MAIYYNEINSFCCAWLRQLIKRGLLPDGEIDNRSIEDVKPDDLKGFTQCHFFTGIGGWPYALREAGWPADREIWTGSCPCQPFSEAGQRKGFADERHLWPAFFHLISQCKPYAVIGEQVASKDALTWFDLVHSDVEGAGYACGVQDTCAAGYGAPHIRQRLYWVAHACDFEKNSVISGGLGDAFRKGLERQSRDGYRARGRQEASGYASKTGGIDRMGDAESCGWRQEQPVDSGAGTSSAEPVQTVQRPGSPCANRSGICETMPTNGFWANPDWLWCRDKKWRPVKSGSRPLVDGFSKGMGFSRDRRAVRQRLQGYGNAIVIPQAVEFIKAFMEII